MISFEESSQAQFCYAAFAEQMQTLASREAIAKLSGNLAERTAGDKLSEQA